jgi:hypothetical protein
MPIVWRYELVLAIRDAVLLKLNNLLSRVVIGNELLIERLFDLLFGDI